MPVQVVSPQIKKADFHAVVTRADGTVEDLGFIATSRRPEWFWLLVLNLRLRFKKG